VSFLNQLVMKIFEFLANTAGSQKSYGQERKY